MEAKVVDGLTTRASCLLQVAPFPGEETYEALMQPRAFRPSSAPASRGARSPGCSGRAGSPKARRRPYSGGSAAIYVREQQLAHARGRRKRPLMPIPNQDEREVPRPFSPAVAKASQKHRPRSAAAKALTLLDQLEASRRTARAEAEAAWPSRWQDQLKTYHAYLAQRQPSEQLKPRKSMPLRRMMPWTAVTGAPPSPSSYSQQMPKTAPLPVPCHSAPLLISPRPNKTPRHLANRPSSTRHKTVTKTSSAAAASVGGPDASPVPSPTLKPVQAHPPAPMCQPPMRPVKLWIDEPEVRQTQQNLTSGPTSRTLTLCALWAHVMLCLPASRSSRRTRRSGWRPKKCRRRSSGRSPAAKAWM